MALITCKDCNKEFSTDARRCPSCGAKKVCKRWPWKKIGICLFIYVMVMQAVIGLIEGLTQKSTSPLTETQLKEKSEREKQIDLGYYCQDLVRKSLHDPDSAEFDDPGSYYVINKKNIYTVSVTLRAKNGFNALRKMTVECSVAAGNDRKVLPLGIKQVQ